MGTTDNSLTLKECRLCGGKAHLVDDYSSELDKTLYQVWHECDGFEGISGGYGHSRHPWFETPWYEDAATAVAAWNRQYERTCEVVGFDDGIDEGADGEWYSYSDGTWYLSCGHEVDGSERPNYCSECGARVIPPDPDSLY